MTHTPTPTTPRTDAAPAMLSESRIRQIELAAKDFEHARVREAYPGAPVAYLRQLIASHRAQAATIARLEAQAERTMRILGCIQEVLTFGPEEHVFALDEIESLVTPVLAGDGPEYDPERARAALRTAAQPAPGSEDGGGE